VGPTRQWREGARDIPFRAPQVSGPWAPFLAGPKVTPRPFSYFLFFFFFSFSGFLFLFLSFAKMLQINSNFFHKFCKIQNSHLK
jgi:hypothetical protein